jgi:hypothetical protein
MTLLSQITPDPLTIYITLEIDDLLASTYGLAIRARRNE